MKILLDENIPILLKKDLPEMYEWFTVRELGWQGTKNGQLLKRMLKKNSKDFLQWIKTYINNKIFLS